MLTSLRLYRLLLLLLFLLLINNYLFCHNVNVMEIFFINYFVLCRSSWWSCCYCWFRYHFMNNIESISLVLKVMQSIFLKSIRDANVNTCWWKNSMNFIEHLFCVCRTSISTYYWIKGTFVNNSIKTTIIKSSHWTNIHLLVSESWVLHFINFTHVICNIVRDINASYVLILLIKHFFRKS